MRRDLICSLALLAVAAGYYWLAQGLGTSALSDAVGAGGLPVIYATVLAALGALLGLKVLLHRWLLRTAAATPASETANPMRILLRGGGALAIGIAYLLVVRLIGYPFAIALTIAAMAVYQGETLSWRLALTAGAGAAAFYLLFVRVLGIAMPAPWSL